MYMYYTPSSVLLYSHVKFAKPLLLQLLLLLALLLFRGVQGSGF